MSDLDAKLARIRSRTQVDWLPERAERALEGTLRYQRRRKVTRSALLASGMLSLALAAVAWRTHSRAPLEVADASLVRFQDGSLAHKIGDTTMLVETERNHVVLARGTARFSVVHDSSRRFVIDAGLATIEVLGTEFTVARSTDNVLVSVTRGRVRVRDESGAAVLTDGDSERFPRPMPPTTLTPMPLVPTVPVAPVSPSSPALSSAPKPKSHHDARPTWQALAHDGDFDHAYVELALHPVAPRDPPVELLLAADVARLSHHPATAVPALQTLLMRYPSDPRAPLAAFTLGRVLLDELGRPREAAQAFVAAQSDPSGPLAEDALAREVEALSRAGDTAKARTRALTYIARYPQGGRLRLVRRYGGLE